MSVFNVKAQWNSYANSRYIKPLLGLMGGQTFAMALPILAAPVLGRLYLPSDYGALGLYLGISATMGTLATLQLHEAILAEKSQKHAEQLILLGMICGGFVATIAALLALGMQFYLSDKVDFAAVRTWIWLLPLSVVTTALNHSINSFCTRTGRFKYLAILPTTVVGTTVALSLVFGFWRWGANGLFASYFGGQAVAALGALWMLARLAPKKGDATTWLALARRHRRFITYTLPSRFVGEFNMQMPVYALGVSGSGAVLGLFTRARVLITLPLTMIGDAVGQVYRQRASEEFRQTGSCRRVFKRTLFGLVAVAAPTMAALAWLGPEVFAVFLGPNWREAGELARILAPMLFLRMITTPLSSTLSFAKAQRTDFRLSILGGLILLGGVLAPAFLGASSVQIVVAFSISMSVVYLTHLLASWNASSR